MQGHLLPLGVATALGKAAFSILTHGQYFFLESLLEGLRFLERVFDLHVRYRGLEATIGVYAANQTY